MFEDEMPAGYSNNQNLPEQDPKDGLMLLVLLAASVLFTSWLIYTPRYLDIEIVAQVLPLVLSLMMLFASTRVNHKFINRSIFPLCFSLVFICWAYSIFLNTNVPTMQDEVSADIGIALLAGMSDAMYILGLFVSIILLHRYFRFAIYLSSASVISFTVLLFIFASQNTLFIVSILLILSTAIALSFAAFRQQSHIIQHAPAIEREVLKPNELLPSEIAEQEIIPELAINALPLNETSATHDWETILKELHAELKSISDVDVLFKRMLVFLNGRMEFNGAAVGMLQDRSIKKIAAYGDDEFIHSQCLGWNNTRIKEVFSSREAILSRQSHISASGIDNAEPLHRLDIPVIASQKAVGIVTIFRETLLFDIQDVKIASSIVFQSMLALKQARLQDEVKRLTTERGANHKTLYSREQFVQMVNPIMQKIGKPRECSLFIIDLDNMSNINDNTGRDAAAFLYKSISKSIISELTDNDVLGRYGKEGFIVMLDETDLNGAKQKAEAIRKKIAQQKVSYKDQVLATTASIGLTIVSDAEENLSSLMRKADMGLFVAKENGSDTVKVSL